MRTRFLILLLFAGAFTTRAFSADPPSMPSPDTVVQWADFDRKISFKREKVIWGDWPHWGKPVWIASYEAPKESLTSFVFALYESGSYIQNSHLDEFRKEAQKFADKPAKDQPIHIDKLPDGRELFTYLAGLGPGGGVMMSFAHSKDGRYDIVLGMFCDSQHEVPPEERHEQPAQPKASLSEIFLKFDAHLNTR